MTKNRMNHTAAQEQPLPGHLLPRSPAYADPWWHHVDSCEVQRAAAQDAYLSHLLFAASVKEQMDVAIRSNDGEQVEELCLDLLKKQQEDVRIIAPDDLAAGHMLHECMEAYASTGIGQLEKDDPPPMSAVWMLGRDGLMTHTVSSPSEQGLPCNEPGERASAIAVSCTRMYALLSNEMQEPGMPVAACLVSLAYCSTGSSVEDAISSGERREVLMGELVRADGAVFRRMFYVERDADSRWTGVAEAVSRGAYPGAPVTVEDSPYGGVILRPDDPYTLKGKHRRQAIASGPQVYLRDPAAVAMSLSMVPTRKPETVEDMATIPGAIIALGDVLTGEGMSADFKSFSDAALSAMKAAREKKKAGGDASDPSMN